MSFKNLEERFNAKVNDLYAAAQNKYDGGRKSDGINDDPLITRRVADGYWGFGESRSVPTRSAALDTQRLTLFTLSQRGILFLAKQQLLQTGNTFEHTRIINPGFIIGNTVPFLHIRRQLRPISGLVSRTDASSFTREEFRKIAQLQRETYDKFSTGEKSFGYFLKKIPVIGQTISAVTAGRSVGESISWKKSRPELSNGSIVSTVDKANEKYQKDNDRYIKDLTKDVILTSKPDKQQPFLKYFTADKESITSRNKIRNGSNAQTLAEPVRNAGRRIRYIKDPANTEAPVPSQNILEKYNKLRTRLETNRFEDAILVSFAMGNNDPVQFRSFIRDLTQSATPEYKTYQYIGRIERFVYYITVEREINFKLDLLAFSKDELKLVWERLNYLTGMVFPYGITRGILQPNIVKLTIGNVYHDQPGYITSFNVNFNEISESWDLDNEVPIGATVDMSFKLIEKATKTANSPFYGITGDIRVPGPPPEIQEPSEPELVALDDVQLNLDTQELSRQIVPTIPTPAFPPPPIR